MAIPVIYNLRSVRVRWTSAVVAVLGIAGTVAVFVAMLSLAHGFKATLVSSGSSDNAILMQAGATSELTGAVSLEEVKVAEAAPGVARSTDGALMSPEVVVIANLPLRSAGTDANVQIRGNSPRALQVRGKVKIVEGRFFRPGLTEVVVGRNALRSYEGLALGSDVKFGGGSWRVVGVFDSGGSAFDSEVWCDYRILNQVYHRPEDMFQSVTLRLTTPAAFQEFKDAIISDPRMTVDVLRELDYYERQSRTLTKLIVSLGWIVGITMGIGAVFGALNTMYSAVAERSREIAILRALGFGTSSVVVSFMLEALLISFLGGMLGCLTVLPLNGFTAGTLNLQTFTHQTFAFGVSPVLVLSGILFALIMGLVGGLLPAIRAARRPVVEVLRAL
jgi:putative ABC transport system permease protein